MTEAHALRDDPAPERPGNEGTWPVAVDEADLSGGTANALALPPPVSVPDGPAGVHEEDGTRLASGLTWEIASGPEAPVLRKGAPHVLRLPKRRARLADTADGPCGSLLLQMAADLVTVFFPAASGPWVFFAELPQPDGPPLVWMAVADIAGPETDSEEASAGAGVARNVVPRPGPELTFEDPEEALAALQDLLAITDVAGIAVRWLPMRPGMTPEDTHRGPMITGITEIARRVKLEDVGPDALPPDGVDRNAVAAAAVPVFVAPRRLPVRALGGLGIAATALLAGVFVVMPMIEEAFRPEPQLPPELVRAQVAPGAFGAACTAALDAWWPRIIGWQLDSAGCALAGHLPETPALPEPRARERTARPMIVWRHLVPEGGRNIVLARAAARQVLLTWPHEARLDEASPDRASLTLWSTASLPLTRIEAEGDGVSPAEPDEIRGRLAALWAHTPGAVTLQRADRGPDLVKIVTAGGTPAGASLSRAGEVPGIAPVRLVENGQGDGELLVGPVASRELPVTLFEPVQGGLSQ